VLVSLDKTTHKSWLQKRKFPFPTPTLILHGGAGNITRKNLPPDLYAQYESSLLKYLGSTRQWLFSGASALDAAVHAVSLMEDDPLFNCGRGSVFTEEGTIEMEASVMVASINPERNGRGPGSMAAEQKRGTGVMLVKNTRHPIQLAREVLLVKPNGKASSMHCQLSGPDLEEWGWKERGLERKDHSWFWTKRRWAEHLRGLHKEGGLEGSGTDPGLPMDDVDAAQRDDKDGFLPSQGTVGAVCMDSWGDVAVATSTGGLTNKKVGRIGDTPTLGAGFWAESWDEPIERSNSVAESQLESIETGRKALRMADRLAKAIDAGIGDFLRDCFPHSSTNEQSFPLLSTEMEPRSADASSSKGIIEKQPKGLDPPSMIPQMDRALSTDKSAPQRRAVAISGTGNGDSFLRMAACRTTAAICRFSISNAISKPISLANAMNMTAGPDGEMQRSAGDRWKVTGEGEAGMIGIEIVSDGFDTREGTLTYGAAKPRRQTGKVVSDFNCGGLWRAWTDEKTGKAQVMVFRGEYH
jgi:L-asparaginase